HQVAAGKLTYHWAQVFLGLAGGRCCDGDNADDCEADQSRRPSGKACAMHAEPQGHKQLG
ncbi:MAG TPA: hypothetical protein DIU48_02460, partial [Acidobacteria bacterium]|nr:hypothetical protein [Acidobacteriota bacterium]